MVFSYAVAVFSTLAAAFVIVVMFKTPDRSRRNLSILGILLALDILLAVANLYVAVNNL